MAITASVQPEPVRIVYNNIIMPDPTTRTLFCSFFSKEGMGHTVQNPPGSDLDGLVSVWPNSSGLKARKKKEKKKAHTRNHQTLRIALVNVL